MAVAGRNYQKTYSFASQDWDMLSSDCEETASQLVQERLSVASLSSDESDAVIIFGGNKLTKANSVKSYSSTSGDKLVNADKSSNNSTWEITHEKLLADISKDPILQRVMSESGRPVEQRLFEQIAQLEDKLENAQDEAKLLFIQNEKLCADNELLRRKLENTIKLYNTKQLNNSELRKGKSSDIKRATILLAAGMGLIVLVKKKLLLSSVGVAGTLVFAGSLGVYNYLNDEEEKVIKVKS